MLVQCTPLFVAPKSCHLSLLLSNLSFNVRRRNSYVKSLNNKDVVHKIWNRRKNENSDSVKLALFMVIKHKIILPTIGTCPSGVYLLVSYKYKLYRSCSIISSRWSLIC